jgi:hypothetical protein
MNILIVLIILIIILLIFFYNKNKKTSPNNNLVKKDDDLIVPSNNNDSYFPIIEVIEDNSLIPNENKKITDSKIKNALSKIDNASIQSTKVKKEITKTKDILDSNKVFFSASTSDAKKMLKAGNNKYYGTQIDKNTNKFIDQTKFTKENSLMKNITKEGITSASFNALSMVVGQYYMSEINDKMEELKSEIKEVSNYLKSEYQAKITTIISKLKEIIDNQTEILSNETNIKNSYEDIKSREEECSNLLGQANDSINNNIKDFNLEYKDYINKTNIIEEWFIKQQILIELLNKIGDLRYLLSNGNESYKLSHSQYNNYLILINKTNIKLQSWHNYYINKFGIDIEKNRKKGTLFKVRENTIGKIKEEWNYKKLENNLVKEISSQITREELKPVTKEKKDEHIKLLKQNGEYYYLQDK